MGSSAFARLETWSRARPGTAALILGAIAAVGFRPLALWPFALLAMAGFVALVGQARDWSQAARLGWLFGIGHFTLGNNWIATAFTYQSEMPVALGWVAVPLLSLYLAIYPAISAGLAKRVAGSARGWALVLAMSSCWIIGEWLRSWVFTGFAWNPFGIILLGSFDARGLAAVLPWLGTYALSGLAVLVAGAGLVCWRQRRQIALAIGSVLLAIAMLVPAGPGDKGRVSFTLVQPDIRQDALNNPALYEDHFAKIARLSLPYAEGHPRLVLWPESAVPDYLRDGYPRYYYNESTANGDPAFARARIGRVIGAGSMLLSGTVDLAIKDGKAAGAYNSVTALDERGTITGSYAKAHLVPYGEYLALRWLLEPLGAARLVAGSIDFLPGPGPRTLDLGPLGQAGVQVCYEIIFSGQVVDSRQRPDFIFNPSNDGWFGSWGPPQHLAQARLRAMEEGLPVLRATTTGISAVIDARGIVRSHIPRHIAGRIDGFIPPASTRTLFSRLGNSLPLAWAAILLALALVASRRERR